MIAIHFIVNPIAGNAKNKISEDLLRQYFEPSNYRISIKTSRFKGNAIDLTKEAIKEKANIIVACGGDGTVNEVASTLVGCNIPLGIVPIGSGNGLASNLNLPKSLHKSLMVIKNQKSIKIDVAKVNNRYFFSNMGFGFTANVISNYEASQRRTLWCYARACIKSFVGFSKREEISIAIDGEMELLNPFLIFVSNSNVMGYKMSLTPKASLQDGLLDVIIVPRLGRLKMLWFGMCMLFNRIEILKETKSYQTQHLSLIRSKGAFFESQVDGEFLKIISDTILIGIERECLEVLI